MAPDERRQAIIEATLPLLLKQGTEISTREIASVAGVAEGTIFRVFETKQDLIHATIHAALQPDAALAQLELLPDQPLTDRVVSILEVLQAESHRTRSLFTHLAQSSGRKFPPHPPPPGGKPWAPGRPHDGRERLMASVATSLAAYTDELAVPTDLAAQVLTVLAFVTSLPLTQDNPLTRPDQLALVVLHGIAKGET